MSSGDPQASWAQWPYPYPTHDYYFGPGRLAPNYGYYHFQPHQNFCPCCGKPMHGYQTPRFGPWGDVFPVVTSSSDTQGYAGYNRQDPA